MLKSKKGFTLIELVMVIVILAILAAVAIPRFIDLRTDARNSTAKGIGAAIMGAATMLHAQYLVNSTVYTLGTTGGNQTLQILAVANISGGPTVTAAGAAGSTVGSGGGALITIGGLGGDPYTLTLTLATLGPGVVYTW